MSGLQSRVQDAALLALSGNRDAAIAEYERIIADIEAGHGFFGEADVRSAFADVLHQAGDPREGPQLTKAVALYQRDGDIPRTIDACLRMCRLHQHSESVARYWVDRAVAAAERGRPEDLSRPLALRGELLLASGHVNEAIATFEKVVTLPGGDDYREQLASAQVGVGRLQDGLATLTRALAAAESAQDRADATRVISLHIRLAEVKRATGHRAAALDLLKSAFARANGLEDDVAFAMTADRLGHALLENGDPSGAAGLLERGIDRARASTPPQEGLLASLSHNLGNVLGALGNLKGSMHAFAEAIRLSRKTGNLKSEALSLFGLANVAARIDDAASARDAYEQARALAERLGNQSLEAACLDSLGQVLARNDEPAKAIDLHTRAADLHHAIGDASGEHTDLMNLAQSLLLLGETAAARRALDRAGSLGTVLGELPWQHALIDGHVSAREQRWPQARESFDAAIAHLERERESLSTPQDQRRWAAQRVDAFEIAAAAAFDARDAMAALIYLERNRARFLDAMAEDRRRLPAGLPAATRQAYLAATNRLADLRWQRREHPDQIDRELEVSLDRATREWEALDAEVERLRMDEPARIESIPAPAELAAILTPGETAVALHAGNEWIGAACIGRRRDGTLWSACDTDPGFTLKQLSRMVVGRAAGDAVAFRPAWHELTQLDAAGAKTLVIRTCDTLSATVWPLVERIVHDQADALLLMPGRGLNVLPLHAAETSDGRLAMDRWSVRYAPSLALLARAGAPGSLDATRTLGQAVNPTRDLSFADVEAASIARRWTGPRRDPLTGPYAQPDRVLRLFDQADALHFAGHAAFDPDDPLRSRLVCAPNAAGDTITLQTLLERTTAVRTRVVLLSACETGRVMAEDPLNDQLGLPGGLLIAGASAVLATFWRVNDLAACLVVSKCVELWEQESIDLERALARSQEWLRTRVTVAVVRDWLDERLADRPANRDALHQARQSLATRQDGDLVFSSPLYWAPFHVTGRAMRVRS